jgi:hypothetical protein
MKLRALLILALFACAKGETPGGSDSAAATVPADNGNGMPAPGSPISLTAADVDGFVKGITKEAQLVREGQVRAGKAVTAVERGNAIQSTFEENTMKNAVEASGLPLERYRLVRQTLSRLLTTLDFQGKIDGPQSVDTAHADADMKARLASDPYSALDSGSAELVKSKLSVIAPAWIDYITLTAVSG